MNKILINVMQQFFERPFPLSLYVVLASLLPEESSGFVAAAALIYMWNGEVGGRRCLTFSGTAELLGGSWGLHAASTSCLRKTREAETEGCSAGAFNLLFSS